MNKRQKNKRIRLYYGEVILSRKEMREQRKMAKQIRIAFLFFKESRFQIRKQRRLDCKRVWESTETWANIYDFQCRFGKHE